MGESGLNSRCTQRSPAQHRGCTPVPCGVPAPHLTALLGKGQRCCFLHPWQQVMKTSAMKKGSLHSAIFDLSNLRSEKPEAAHLAHVSIPTDWSAVSMCFSFEPLQPSSTADLASQNSLQAAIIAERQCFTCRRILILDSELQSPRAWFPAVLLQGCSGITPLNHQQSWMTTDKMGAPCLGLWCPNGKH